MDLLPKLLSHPQPLTTGAAHLWLLDAGRFQEKHLNQALDVMSIDEHERAQKFVRGKHEYIASRWLLRSALSRYLQQPPHALKFARHEKGKPYIPGQKIQFNLSHSGRWAVLTITSGAAVGVDVEEGKSSRDLTGIAANYYHTEEFLRLQELPPEEQTLYFYQLWTLKEALLKATGAGISAGLENLNFSIEPEISVEISPSLPAEFFANKWHFHQWQLPDASLCALATACANKPAIHWFDAINIAG